MDNITVGGVTLHSPLLNAAGTMGFGSSYADYIDLHRLGGLVTRTMTVNPRRGAEAPRLWETPSGLLNCVGMQNPGYEKFTQVFYKGLVGYDVPIIANVTGTPEEIRRMADALAELPAVAGVEVNLYCTYEEYRALGNKAYLEQCAQRIRAAADGRLPVWAKLSPCAGDIVDAARTAQDAGAQAVVCANTYWGMALQADGSSRLGSMVGGLSGPAIRPLSVFQTWRVAQEVAVDVVGCGGIVCAADVKEYMAAGAKAVDGDRYCQLHRAGDDHTDRRGTVTPADRAKCTKQTGGMDMVAVGISGATGCIYGIRLLEALRALGQETELILSDWGAETIRLETNYTAEQVKALADRVSDNRNMAAQAASGSSCADAMVIAPCSMKTLAGIAMGYDDSLLVRAADVMLKERRRLILLTRETPLNLSHIRNMETVTLMGGIILPPVPTFYSRPQTVDDIVDQTVSRTLRLLGLDGGERFRWNGNG